MNCIIIDDDNLTRRLIEEYIQQTAFLQLNNSFSCPPKGKKKDLVLETIDIIFLDVEMPGTNGFEFIKSLENPPVIILMSSNINYAVDAFSFEVADFLLKPVSFNRFKQSVEKAISIINSSNSTVINLSKDGLFLKKGSSYIKIKYEEISYIEAMENYVHIKTQLGNYTVHQSLKVLEEKLPNTVFKRIHRSYIVNLNRVQRIENSEIILEMNEQIETIPIGKNFRNDILSTINLI